MQVTFNLDDRQVLDMTKMVNVGFLVDKAYKAIRSQIIEELIHIRKTISSFDVWFEKLNPAEQDHVRHSMNSTISVEEIVPAGVKNRELIIDAINRYRENKRIYDSGKNVGADAPENVPEGLRE